MAEALYTAGLLALLHAGETVLLPNPRAAGELRAYFNREQRHRGLRAWESPPVHTWSEWSESLWSRLQLEGREERILLNRLQEGLLWETIIEASPEGNRLPRASLRQLAGMASSAFALACAQEGLLHLERTADSPDAHAFAAWQEKFVQECAREGLLSRSLLASALVLHVRAKNIPAIHVVHLAGFEHLVPAQLSLLEVLRRAGARVELHSLQANPVLDPLRVSVHLSDPHEELRWAARWIRQYFDTCNGAAPRVALILPNPAIERAALEPLLREVLAPELEPVDVDLSSTPWHFAAGSALNTLPIIRDALFLLRWLHGEISPDQIGSLLLSPFFDHSEPFEERARFEKNILRRGSRLRPELSLSSFLQLARVGGLDFPELGAVERLVGDSGHVNGTGSHADWTEFIRKLLRSVGWPSIRTLSSAEFRATEAWDGLLDLLATLDFRGGRTTFPELLGLLASEAETTPAPSAIAGAAIEILTLPETEGCSFDAALVLRATDESLPLSERPHPLLGWEFQRFFDLPGTDPVRTHTRSRDRLSGLGERCSNLLLLHAEADENGPQRLTPLAEELAFRPVPPLDLLASITEPAPLVLQSVEEDTLLPLPSLQTSGGARLLELQAACGFRAFATLRLAASLPEDTTLGLDARQRGSLLHKALELFWTEVGSQANLRAQTQEARQGAIERAVHAAFGRLGPGSRPAWETAYLEICERRLRNLIDNWLEHELERSDFTVLPPEQEQLVQVGPLELKVRPDRIDRVDGGFVFIDYKSSADLSTEHWLGERPQAPQLPLYTLLGEAEEVRGLAFARIRPGHDMRWIGLQQEEGDLRHKRGIKLHNLELQVAAWREELDRLAFAFAQGVTSVDPKAYPKTCKYCEQRLLCRLDTATLLTADAEDEWTEETDG